MISVFMGNQNAIERVRVFAQKRHAPHNLARAHAGVDQNARAVSDQQHSVAS
jgi:hypothetical protein